MQIDHDNGVSARPAGVAAARSGPLNWLQRSGHTLAFVGALALLLGMSVVVVRSAMTLIDNNRRVSHTYEVLDRLGGMLLAVQDVETAARGFVLTGDEAFLEPYQTAPGTLNRLQAELLKLTADNPGQHQRLLLLREHLERKLAISAEQIATRRTFGEEEARKLVTGGAGRAAMDVIRVDLAGLRAEEERLLRERTARVETTTSQTMVALAVGLAVSFLLLLGSFAWLRRENAVRRAAQEALRRSEESLAITLNSIGDAVLATDTAGRVTLLNPVAEKLIGWTLAEARGRPVGEVFRIIHETSRAPATIPVDQVLATGETQGLANHTALIARDGTERAIDDSAAPIRDRDGNILGVVLVFRDVSASRRAQAELDRFFSLSLDLLCIAGMDGYFKRVSPTITDMLGWTPAEFLARPFMGMIHPDDHLAAQRELERQVAGHPVMQFECRFQHKDGSWRILSWRSMPHAPSGLMYATARDVTESRKAQAELDRFFALSLDFLCISAPDGYFKRISPGVTAMLGWTVEEFLAMPYIDLVHPDDVPATLREVERQVRDGQQVLNFENRYRHKDGSWRVLSWRSVPDRDSGLMYATARDVTEQKRIEAQMVAASAELSRSRAELRSLFESLPGLYLVLTPDFQIVTASDAYFASTMIKREEVVGRNMFDVFPVNPDDPTADGARNVRASLERVRDTREPDTMPIQKYDIRRPDGTYEERFWSPVHSPLLGPNRQLLYIIHRVEDVTEFVHAQKAGVAGVDLHSRMQKMEAEIFQGAQKIAAAKQQLEVANKELESFSYSVSHDLRAPLRHIQGYVEMLTREAKDVLSEKSRRYLQTIADAGREMGVLIDDLLAFSRMGRSEMADQEVDLTALVAEVRRGLQPAAGDRDIRWTVGPLPRVRGDAPMLRQVLVNLLSNAVKYTRDRQPAEITIGAAGLEEGGRIFFVRDNGAGFDMKYAGKLFGVFQRLHRADEFEGTGIGLASVRRIIARHGGRTWAEGELNAGATFYFTLKPVDSPTDPTPRLP